MKLDAFSKILVATGQINYMASTIEGVNSDYKVIIGNRDVEQSFKESMLQSFEDRKSVLDKAVEKLAEVMNLLANNLNNTDALCAIDMRVAKVPFEIIVGGMDDSDIEYDSED